MSNNPQWKMFQPPESHSSPLHDILDLQQTTMQSKQVYRNVPRRAGQSPDNGKRHARHPKTVGAPRTSGSYSGEYPSSPRDSYNNGLKSGSGKRYSGFNMDGCPMGDSAYSSSSTNNSSNYDSTNHPPIRETGIIEKLLHSYGFIQCCERQARLFFHFSQFSGNTEHLKIGDPVEFEMTYDRRTGKPIASTVTKIAPEVVLSEARVTGTVTTEVKGEGSGDNTGRISYENRGECFFLPYTKDDVEGNVVLRTGDAVSFQIATNQRGTLGACHVRFENPQHPVKYNGVVCSMKENFGFIERADVVKEIFFHYSEAKDKEELMLGDDVEFLIQTRNGKEVACNISKLPSGSVVFEDVAPEMLRGQVLKPLERDARAAQGDPLPGRVRYRAPDHAEVEVPFGDKDQVGEFTLRHGDWVQFQVATDRRDQLKRATNIALLDESFSVSGERREQGVVSALREGYGLLRAVEREQAVVFQFAEVLRLGQDLRLGDEVEFTVDPASGARPAAIRVQHLPPGAVAFETLLERGVRGTVAREPRDDRDRLDRDRHDRDRHDRDRHDRDRLDRDRLDRDRLDRDRLDRDPLDRDCLDRDRLDRDRHDRDRLDRDRYDRDRTDRERTDRERTDRERNDREWNDRERNDRLGSPDRDQLEYSGFINCQINQSKKTIPFKVKKSETKQLRPGDKVVFDVYQVKRTKELVARGVHAAGGGRAPAHGYVAALKDGFGFIETADHNKEVFFHFSNLEGSPERLELGAEVEYAVGRGAGGGGGGGGAGGGGGGCASAEWVRALPRGTLPQPRACEPPQHGTVTRTLRALNPDQPQYSGLVQSEAGESYEFGITGLACKRDILQVGDPVTFRVDAAARAAHIAPVRRKRRALVDAIKGGFGFLSVQGEDARRLFFHMSEVRGPAALQPGDTVEFVMLTNPRNGKCSACNVLKIASKGAAAARPERVAARVRGASLEEGAPRVLVLRAPRGPDGTRGFRPRRPLAATLAD